MGREKHSLITTREYSPRNKPVEDEASIMNEDPVPSVSPLRIASTGPGHRHGDGPAHTATRRRLLTSKGRDTRTHTRKDVLQCHTHTTHREGAGSERPPLAGSKKGECKPPLRLKRTN